MTDKRLILVSKCLAKHLRHAPETIGLTLEPGGWVGIVDLLTATADHRFPIAYDELIEVVESNDKQRFAISDDGAMIRANQGHSVAVDLQLDEQKPPPVLFHGTIAAFLPSIRSEGLIRGRRHHVHLSPDRQTAARVGARRGKPVILQVSSAAMHAAGHKFFVSANGVWLTDQVPPDYLTLHEGVTQ